MVLLILMFLLAFKVRLWAPVQLTESLTLILPLVPVAPSLLKIVTLVEDKLAPKVAPEISPPVPTV